MYLRDHKRHCTTDTVTFPLALYAAVPAALRLVEHPGPLHVLVGAVGGRVGCSGARRLQQQRAAEGGLGQGVQHPGAGRGLGPHTAPEQDIYTQIRLLLSSHPQYLDIYVMCQHFLCSDSQTDQMSILNIETVLYFFTRVNLSWINRHLMYVLKITNNSVYLSSIESNLILFFLFLIIFIYFNLLYDMKRYY